MAFSVISRADLPVSIQAASSAANSLPLHTNVLRRSTIGVAKLHKEIAASKRFITAVSPANIRLGENGFIDITQPLPIFAKRYCVNQLLGCGVFSQVFHATDSFLDVPVALKILKPSYNAIGRREAVILETLTNRGNFCRIMEKFMFQGRVCIVMKAYESTLAGFIEFSPENSKSELLKPTAIRTVGQVPVQPSIPNGGKVRRLGMRSIQKVAADLLSCLAALQACDLIHCDIKPENCFLSKKAIDTANGDVGLGLDADVVLGDLGSCIHTSEIVKYFVDFDLQTLPYRAPEVLLGIEIGFSADIWSLGVLLVELYTGKELFCVSSRDELVTAVHQRLARFPPQYFRHGKFSHLLDTLPAKGSALAANSENKERAENSAHEIQAELWKSLRTLLACSGSRDGNEVLWQQENDFVHFLSGLLFPVPTLRLTAWEALQHRFLRGVVQMPPAPPRQDCSSSGAQAVKSVYRLRSTMRCTAVPSIKGVQSPILKPVALPPDPDRVRIPPMDAAPRNHIASAAAPLRHDILVIDEDSGPVKAVEAVASRADSDEEAELVFSPAVPPVLRETTPSVIKPVTDTKSKKLNREAAQLLELENNRVDERSVQKRKIA